MSYFNKFPKTIQSSVQALDITRRASISSELNGELYNYVPYEVKEGERPEEVAYYYYGSASFAFLVLLANNIIDPYSQWPKSQYDLDEYIKVKYSEASGTSGRAVLEWSQKEFNSNQTPFTDNIKYYAHRRNGQIRINHQTYINFPPRIIDSDNPANETSDIIIDQEFSVVDFTPIRVYQYETELNEQSRRIVLFDQRLVTPINRDLAKALSND